MSCTIKLGDGQMDNWGPYLGSYGLIGGVGLSFINYYPVFVLRSSQSESRGGGRISKGTKENDQFGENEGS